MIKAPKFHRSRRREEADARQEMDRRKINGSPPPHVGGYG
jgi:hypothetical protein